MIRLRYLLNHLISYLLSEVIYESDRRKESVSIIFQATSLVVNSQFLK